MGQYHFPVNLDRKEYLYSHTFGDGLKLMEFGLSGMGMMSGLAVLLAASNGRGGGDLYSRAITPSDVDVQDFLVKHMVGRWAGQRIGIIGDYYELGDMSDFGHNIYMEIFGEDADPEWVDISSLVMDTLRIDHYFNSQKGDVEVYSPRPVAILREDGSITNAPAPAKA